MLPQYAKIVLQIEDLEELAFIIETMYQTKKENKGEHKGEHNTLPITIGGSGECITD